MAVACRKKRSSRRVSVPTATPPLTGSAPPSSPSTVHLDSSTTFSNTSHVLKTNPGDLGSLLDSPSPSSSSSSSPSLLGPVPSSRLRRRSLRSNSLSLVPRPSVSRQMVLGLVLALLLVSLFCFLYLKLYAGGGRPVFGASSFSLESRNILKKVRDIEDKFAALNEASVASGAGEGGDRKRLAEDLAELNSSLAELKKTISKWSANFEELDAKARKNRLCVEEIVEKMKPLEKMEAETRQELSAVKADVQKIAAQGEAPAAGRLEGNEELNSLIRGIVSRNLEAIRSDFTNQIDYCLARNGAWVAGASKTYFGRRRMVALVRVLSKLLFIEKKLVGRLINGNVSVGNCWPMEGRQGYFEILFGQPVKIKEVLYEHVNKNILLDARGAPKKMKGFGIVRRSSGSDAKVFLGDIKMKGEAVMNGMVVEENEAFYDGVRVEVDDNFGKDEYTCLYRLRVHGEREGGAGDR